MTKIAKYNVTYKTGGGTEYNDGEWEIKITPKTIRATKIKEYMTGVYAMHKIGESFKIGMNTGNPFSTFKDGTFIVYFQQAGTPYTFEPIDAI
jgi:hypothetical protein